MGSDEAPSMTATARAKLTGVWTSFRSIALTTDDEARCRSPDADTTEATANPLESVMRAMFGSCTAGDTTAAAAEVTPTSSKDRSSFDEHIRAMRAVDSLRERAEQRESSPSNRKLSMPKPFLASLPERKGKATPMIVHEVVPPVAIPDTETFDDGISAISAHTLDEIERQNQLKGPYSLNKVRSDRAQERFVGVRPTVSTESTLIPPTDLDEERETIGAAPSPFGMERGRSNMTWGSGKRTVQTKSTQSSTEFETLWRQDEQRYWTDTVKEDEHESPTIRKGSVRHLNMLIKERGIRGRSRSRESEQLSLKQVGTNTTAGSSAFSGLSSPFGSKHPHETMPYAPSDFVPSMTLDPDRIQGDLVAIDSTTEIGEI